MHHKNGQRSSSEFIPSWLKLEIKKLPDEILAPVSIVGAIMNLRPR